jgi:hypothetical protein
MKTLIGVMTGILVFCSSISAQAALLEGQSVYFQFADEDLEYFGTPSVEGNSLAFNFSGISADSSSASEREFLEFQVLAKTGYQVDSFHLSAGGDYSLAGKNSSVSVSSRLRLDDFTNDELFRESTEKSFKLGGAGGEKVGSWNALFEQAVARSEELDVLLTTTLWALPAGTDGEAGIHLSSIRVSISAILSVGEPAAVPLPAAMWLLGSGLVGLIGVAGRNRRGAFLHA